MRTLLVDGSRIFRMGMQVVLEGADDVTIVGEADDARAAEACSRSVAPDLVITDLDLPDHDFSWLVSALRAVTPAARLLVLSTRVSDAIVKQTLLAGAGGHVFKSQAPDEIIAAAREVARGRQVLPSGGATASEPGPRLAGGSTLERLSAREREIFDLIIWGQTNKQVALRLGISVKTVETHRSHINGKLQVHSAAELVRLASLCGALADGGPPAPAPGDTPRAPRLVAHPSALGS